MKASHYFLTILFLSTAMLTVGCSKPAVKHSAISGEVRQIENWRLVCDNIRDIDEIDVGKVERTPGMPEQHKYTRFEFCTRFMGDLRGKLLGKYELNVAENFPQTGTIHVLLASQKLAAYVLPADTSNLYQDISPGDRVGRTGAVSPEVNLVAATASLFTDKDQVNGATVTITDIDNKILGQVFVGGDYGKRIKPDFLAKVINEVIRNGRYKGSKGVNAQVGGNYVP